VNAMSNCHNNSEGSDADKGSTLLTFSFVGVRHLEHGALALLSRCEN
jgi:hypothetical protein